MKSIYTLYEASLLDVQGTIDAGDELSNEIELEFNNLKEAIKNRKIWNLKSDSRIDGFYNSVTNAIKCKKLLNALGYTELDGLKITIKIHKWDKKGTLSIYATRNAYGFSLNNKGEFTISIDIPGGKRSFAFKTLDNMVKDIDSFAEFLKDNRLK
jgi:hypothetical protein